MGSSTVRKDPASVEPIGFDYTEFLAELGAGVTISSSTWTVSTNVGDVAPLEIVSDEILPGGLLTQAILSGGECPAGPPSTLGSAYWVTNHFITSTNVVDERSRLVQIVQR